MSSTEPVIDVRGLAKRYGGATVIEGVTLTLNAGEMVGLVGANGGGKTTTLRILAGLIAADGGEGTVLGEDIRRARPGARGIGYMAQKLGLYPELTARENLCFRADAHGLADATARIAETAAQFDIGPVLDTRFERLSGGWARRVQFAATMLHRPRLLLLDEPTAGLDVATKRAIWGWLAAFTGAGHAVVIATHDLIEAERCPAILHYAGGRASDAATPAAFVASSGAATLEEAVLARAAA